MCADRHVRRNSATGPDISTTFPPEADLLETTKERIPVPGRSLAVVNRMYECFQEQPSFVGVCRQPWAQSHPSGASRQQVGCCANVAITQHTRRSGERCSKTGVSQACRHGSSCSRLHRFAEVILCSAGISSQTVGTVAVVFAMFTVFPAEWGSVELVMLYKPPSSVKVAGWTCMNFCGS